MTKFQDILDIIPLTICTFKILGVVQQSLLVLCIVIPNHVIDDRFGRIINTLSYLQPFLRLTQSLTSLRSHSKSHGPYL